MGVDEFDVGYTYEVEPWLYYVHEGESCEIRLIPTLRGVECYPMGSED